MERIKQTWRDFEVFLELTVGEYIDIFITTVAVVVCCGFLEAGGGGKQWGILAQVLYIAYVLIHTLKVGVEIKLAKHEPSNDSSGPLHSGYYGPNHKNQVEEGSNKDRGPTPGPNVFEQAYKTTINEAPPIRGKRPGCEFRTQECLHGEKTPTEFLATRRTESLLCGWDDRMFSLLRHETEPRATIRLNKTTGYGIGTEGSSSKQEERQTYGQYEVHHHYRDFNRGTGPIISPNDAYGDA